MMQQEGITFDKIIKNFRASDGSFIAPSLLREKVKRLEKFIRPESGKTRSFSILNNQGSQSLQAEQHRVEMLRRKQEREIQNLITFEMRVYIMTQVQRAEIEKENEEKLKAEEARMKEIERQKDLRRKELQEKKVENNIFNSIKRHQQKKKRRIKRWKK